MDNEAHFGNAFIECLKKDPNVGLGQFFKFKDYQQMHEAATPEDFFEYIETTPYHDVLQVSDPEIVFEDFILLEGIKTNRRMILIHWINPMWVLGTLFIYPLVMTIVSVVAIVRLNKKRHQLDPREGPDPIT